uniref:Somatomedin B and thrombospondin type 1 domain containing n=1 Tax=Naja naja TaxID=35670 RepID=A0A8C6XL05_NAJNA
ARTLAVRLSFPHSRLALQPACAEERRCCLGRDPTCTATGWRPDRTYGTCFCDEGCEQTGDCCHDYAQACPAVSCVVGEWNHWSGCAEQCKPAFRMRTRIIQQEPKNGGEPCPPLEEKAGCLEYATHEGKDCGDVPAFITTSEYSKERKNTAVHPRWSSETKDSSYCVEFKTESLSPYCSMEIRPYARWMQYLRAGYTVCVMCQEPAMHKDSYRCPGDVKILKPTRVRFIHIFSFKNQFCVYSFTFSIFPPSL